MAQLGLGPLDYLLWLAEIGVSAFLVARAAYRHEFLCYFKEGSRLAPARVAVTHP